MLQLMETMIYVDADLICDLVIIHFVEKILGSTKSFLIPAYTDSFRQCHTIREIVHLYGFSVMMKFVVYIRNIICIHSLTTS